MAGIEAAFKRPFQEQIDFFRKKLNLPSERFDDITRAAHDRGFIVAGATRADLLTDLAAAVDRALSRGATLTDFRADFRALVARHGWTGWTGEGSKAGEAWRTKVIWQTNLRTSHAAGRYAQLTSPEGKKAFPYWRYVHDDLARVPRPQHQAWGDMRLTLPVDHPFWQTHFPPNGWGCGCRVVGVPAPGPGDATEAPAGWDQRDEHTGQMPGIDRGWDYAPGAHADTALRQFVSERLITYPPAITRALTKEVGRHVNATDRVEDFVRDVVREATRREPLWQGFVEMPARMAQAVKTDLRGFTIMLPADVVRHVDKHHGHDGRGQRTPTARDYRLLPQALAEGEILPAHPGPDQHERFGVKWRHGDEEYRAIYEVRAGKHNRAITLVSLLVKTK
jgi:hypothetical protein